MPGAGRKQQLSHFLELLCCAGGCLGIIVTWEAFEQTLDGWQAHQCCPPIPTSWVLVEWHHCASTTTRHIDTTEVCCCKGIMIVPTPQPSTQARTRRAHRSRAPPRHRPPSWLSAASAPAHAPSQLQMCIQGCILLIVYWRKENEALQPENSIWVQSQVKNLHLLASGICWLLRARQEPGCTSGSSAEI